MALGRRSLGGGAGLSYINRALWRVALLGLFLDLLWIKELPLLLTAPARHKVQFATLSHVMHGLARYAEPPLNIVYAHCEALCVLCCH